MRPSASACRDDLFARSRRATLSAFERRALDAHLGVCDLCRAARAFASLYDGVADRPAAEEDALIARLADRVAGGRPAVGRRRRTTVIAVAAGAALLIVAGGAAAWVSGLRPPAVSSASDGARSRAAAPAAASPRAPAHALSGDTPSAEAPAEGPLSGEAPARHDTTMVATRPRAHAYHRELAGAAPADATPTAANLFAAANAARRARDLRGAVDRYFALERRFPDSEEALLSLVSAADLLSRLGEPEVALGAFDRYLARRPEGALAPEALFGRARSLQSLGRGADEIAAWRLLLRAFSGIDLRTRRPPPSRRALAVTIGARRARRCGLILAAVSAGSNPAAAERPGRAEINIVMGAPCAPELRDVIADQLADLATAIVWTCRDRFDPEAAFRPAPPGGSGMRAWIDLRMSGEARLTLGDDGSDRFVVRRIPLAHGLDELGREEIGQIVRFATLAVRAGESETLTRTGARAAVAEWPPSPPRPRDAVVRVEAAPRPSPPAVTIGAIWSLQAFSREIPLVHELALGAVVGGDSSALSGWMEGAYRLPARDRTDPIGVEIDAATLRVGLAVGQRGPRFASVGVAAGIGLQRTSFTPLGVATSVDPAAPGTFWSGTARLSVAVALRVTARMTAGARVSGELAAADIHYDLRDASGAAHRVMTPFRLEPGLALGLTWRL